MAKTKSKYALEKAEQWRAVADVIQNMARQLVAYGEYENETLLEFLGTLTTAMPEVFDRATVQELYEEVSDDVEAELEAEAREDMRERNALASWLRSQQ